MSVRKLIEKSNTVKTVVTEKILFHYKKCQWTLNGKSKFLYIIINSTVYKTIAISN